MTVFTFEGDALAATNNNNRMNSSSINNNNGMTATTTTTGSHRKHQNTNSSPAATHSNPAIQSSPRCVGMKFDRVSVNDGALKGCLTLTKEEILLLTEATNSSRTIEMGSTSQSQSSTGTTNTTEDEQQQEQEGQGQEDDSHTTTSTLATGASVVASASATPVSTTGDAGNRSSWEWRWPLNMVQENLLVVKPISYTVEITFLDQTTTDSSTAADPVRFRLQNVNDLMRFQKAISQNMRLLRKKKKAQSAAATGNDDHEEKGEDLPPPPSSIPSPQVQNGTHRNKSASTISSAQDHTTNNLQTHPNPTSKAHQDASTASLSLSPISDNVNAQTQHQQAIQKIPDNHSNLTANAGAKDTSNANGNSNTNANNPFLNPGITGIQFSAGQNSIASTTMTTDTSKRKKRRNPGSEITNISASASTSTPMNPFGASASMPSTFGQAFPPFAHNQQHQPQQHQLSPYHPQYSHSPYHMPPSPLTLPYGYPHPPPYPYMSPSPTPPYHQYPYGHPSYPTFHHHAHIPPPPPTYPPYNHQHAYALLNPQHQPPQPPATQPPPHGAPPQQGMPATAHSGAGMPPPSQRATTIVEESNHHHDHHDHPNNNRPSYNTHPSAQSSIASSVAGSLPSLVGPRDSQSLGHYHNGYSNNNHNNDNYGLHNNSNQRHWHPYQPRPRDSYGRDNDDDWEGHQGYNGMGKPRDDRGGDANRSRYDDRDGPWGNGHNNNINRNGNNPNGSRYHSGDHDEPTQRNSNASMNNGRRYDAVDAPVPRNSNASMNNGRRYDAVDAPVPRNSNASMNGRKYDAYDDPPRQRNSNGSNRNGLQNNNSNHDDRRMRRNDSLNSETYGEDNTNIHRLMRKTSNGEQPSRVWSLDKKGIAAVRQHVPELRGSEHSKDRPGTGPSQYEPDYGGQQFRGRQELKRDFRASSFSRSVSPAALTRSHSERSQEIIRRNRALSPRRKDPLKDDSVLDDSSSSSSSSSSSGSSENFGKKKKNFSEPDLTSSRKLTSRGGRMHAKSSSGDSSTSTSNKQNATFDKKPRDRKAKGRPSIMQRFREFSDRSLKAELNNNAKYNEETGNKLKRDETEPAVLAKPKHASDPSLVSRAKGSTSPAPRFVPRRPMQRGLSFRRAQSFKISPSSNIRDMVREESAKSLEGTTSTVSAPPTATRRSSTAPSPITRPIKRAPMERMQSLKRVNGKPVLPVGASAAGANSRRSMMRKTSSERFLRTSLLKKEGSTGSLESGKTKRRSLLGDFNDDESDESNSDKQDGSSKSGEHQSGGALDTNNDPRGMRSAMSKSKSYCARPATIVRNSSLEEHDDKGSHRHSHHAHDDESDDHCSLSPLPATRSPAARKRMSLRRRESLSVVENSAGRTTLAQRNIESIRRSFEREQSPQRTSSNGENNREPRQRTALARNTRSTSPMIRQSIREKLVYAKPTSDMDKSSDDYDSDDASLEAVRREFALEARLKKEMASLSNPMLGKAKSGDESDESDNASQASIRMAKKELELEERSRAAGAKTRPQAGKDKATRSVGNNDQRRGDRRQLLRSTSSERQLKKPPSLVKKEMARLGSRRNLMAMDSENFVDDEAEHRPSDAKAVPKVRATKPGVQYVRTKKLDDEDDKKPAAVNDNQKTTSDGGDKRKGRRRLLRTSSSDRELQKTPSLVSREMARFGSTRKLLKKGDVGDDSAKPDPAVWRASYEKRKLHLLAARLPKTDDNDKPRLAVERNVARSQSARNIQRPSIYAQASFSSLRSRHTTDDDDSCVGSAASDVWGDAKDNDRDSDAQSRRSSDAASRRSDVRQDLVSLGQSNRSLKGRMYPTAAECEDSLSEDSILSKRPSEEKARPAVRATRPGIQHVKNEDISHSKAKLDMASLGGNQNQKEAAVAPGAPLRRSRSSAGYDEESKEEITADPEAEMPGFSFARNSDMANDGIALKEMQLAGTANSQTDDVPTGRGDLNAAIREKAKLAGDVEQGTSMVDYGTHEFSSMDTDGLIQATLVDDDEDNIVTAVTVDPKEEFKRKRKVYIWVSFGCGCLLLMITLIAVFAGPSPERVPDVPPPLTPEERYEVYYDHLLGLGYNSAVLDDPLSPQGQALMWISMVDTLYEDPTNLNPSEVIEKVNQRFFLVVFYYTMLQDGQWNNCKAPETGESNACVHHNTESFGVEGTYYNQQQSQPTFRWLSSVDECGWGGVHCEDGEWVSHLWLGGNSLEGTLPVELAELRSLKVMDLQQNLLKGSLPPAWGLMAANGSSLESIRLDKNVFTGTIPMEWALLNSTTMREMILAHNFLTGTLPSEFGSLQGMEDFSVMFNSLSGKIPKELGEMSKLQTIHLAHNFFEGRMPTSVCQLVDDDLFEASSDCLNILSDSYVQCSCCTTCCEHNDIGDGTCELKNDIQRGIQRGFDGDWFQSDEGDE